MVIQLPTLTPFYTAARSQSKVGENGPEAGAKPASIGGVPFDQESEEKGQRVGPGTLLCLASRAAAPGAGSALTSLWGARASHSLSRPSGRRSPIPVLQGRSHDRCVQSQGGASSSPEVMDAGAST